MFWITDMPSPSQIWHLDYSKEYDQLKEKTLITTRNCAYSIKWSPQCDHLLASHSHSSKYIEIWDTNRKYVHNMTFLTIYNFYSARLDPLTQVRRHQEEEQFFDNNLKGYRYLGLMFLDMAL